MRERKCREQEGIVVCFDLRAASEVTKHGGGLEDGRVAKGVEVMGRLLATRLSTREFN